MRAALAASVAVLWAMALMAPAHSEGLTIVSEAAVAEAKATRLVVHSARLDRDFEVVVQLPGAAPFLPGQKFAAIYALDGGHRLAGPLSVFLAGQDVMAPAVVVSVDYLPGETRMRNADFSHNSFTVDGQALGGGGAAFEAFLTQELKPFIEARYPADPAGAILFGHSMGAVFAANVFAERPDAFAGYVIASFVEPRDPTVPARVARAAAQAHGQRVFLAVGGDEDRTTAEQRRMRKGFADLSAAFRQGGPALTFKARSYPGENHMSYYPNLVIDGFRFVLPPTVPVNLPYTPLPDSTLARYAGTYGLPDGRTITVKAAYNSRLTAQVADGAPVYLLPNGPDRYYAYTSDLDVRFDADGMTLTGRAAPSVRAARETSR